MTSPVGVLERIPVLTFLTNFFIGGTERQVVNLIRNHDQTRFDVALACFRISGPLLHEIDTAKVTLTDYPITTLASLRTLWQQWRLARYVRTRGIRVVHSFGYYANVFAVPAARLGGAEVVIASIRDTGDHLTWPQKALQKWACRAADHVLVNAQAVRTVLAEQGYDDSRISVIPNGIDGSRFGGRAGHPGTRAELGLPPTSPIVAVFARLNRLKGIEYFLEAAALLTKRFDEARFLIVGDSVSKPYRDELEAYAARLGLRHHVVFAGFRSDVPDLLSEVCVSVLPSLSEGLPNAVLEAMAAGVPVVATSVGGTPEIVEDGVTGLLVPPLDATALALAIGVLLADPDRGRSMGQAGRRRVAERFSLEAAVRDTEALYARLLRAVRERRRKATVRLSSHEQPIRDEEW